MADAPNTSHVSTPALFRLLGHCDATAAALHRFNERSTIQGSITRDPLAWENFVYNELWPEYLPIRDAVVGYEGEGVRNPQRMVTTAERLGREANAELHRLGLISERASVDLAVCWLPRGLLVETAGCLIPNLCHADEETLATEGLNAPIGLTEHRQYFQRQRQLVEEYANWIRRRLLDIIVLPGVSVPEEVYERYRWFAWRCIADGPRVTNEDLLYWLAYSPCHADAEQVASESKNGTERVRVSANEAELLVKNWLRENAIKDPSSVTRDQVVKETGVSSGGVSKSPSWIVFQERRKSLKKPTVREVPLSDRMHARIPTGNRGKAGTVQKDSVLQSLIEEQDEELKMEERRTKRRHEPS